MQESHIDDINFTCKNELNFIRILNEDDDIAIMRPKNIELSVDEILDKISEKGMSSLTKKEINTLEKYSKTI
jgi:molybdate-binding protein